MKENGRIFLKVTFRTRRRLAPLAKGVLILLGLSAGILKADAATQVKIYGSGRHPLDLASRTKTLIISNEKMDDIMKNS